jgi:hypothetical protein
MLNWVIKVRVRIWVIHWRRYKITWGNVSILIAVIWYRIIW